MFNMYIFCFQISYIDRKPQFGKVDYQKEGIDLAIYMVYITSKVVYITGRLNENIFEKDLEKFVEKLFTISTDKIKYSFDFFGKWQTALFVNDLKKVFAKT